MKHYSPQTGGFYDKDVHGKNMPGDVIDIEDEEWQSLLAAQSEGLHIIAGTDRRPIAVVHAPSAQEQAANLIRSRDTALSGTDAIVARHRDEIDLGMPTTLSSEQFTALLRWRGALRSLPQSPAWPNVELPERPV